MKHRKKERKNGQNHEAAQKGKKKLRKKAGAAERHVPCQVNFDLWKLAKHYHIAAPWPLV